jgi:hypothetical protein
MSLTERQLNRATLDRQMLLRRESMEVVDAVRRLVALQAQEPASPYLALWNRLADFDPVELDLAFADRAVVKATLVRIALHTVHAADWPTFHNAMVPILRGSRLTDRRFERAVHRRRRCPATPPREVRGPPAHRCRDRGHARGQAR